MCLPAGSVSYSVLQGISAQVENINPEWRYWLILTVSAASAVDLDTDGPIQEIITSSEFSEVTIQVITIIYYLIVRVVFL